MIDRVEVIFSIYKGISHMAVTVEQADVQDSNSMYLFGLNESRFVIEPSFEIVNP